MGGVRGRGWVGREWGFLWGRWEKGEERGKLTGGKTRLAGEVEESGDRRAEDICVEDAGPMALPTKRQGEVH